MFAEPNYRKDYEIGTIKSSIAIFAANRSEPTGSYWKFLRQPIKKSLKYLINLMLITVKNKDEEKPSRKKFQFFSSGNFI